MSDEVPQQEISSSESGIVGQTTMNDRATVARQTSLNVSTRIQTGASRPNDNLARLPVIPADPIMLLCISLDRAVIDYLVRHFRVLHFQRPKSITAVGRHM